MTEEEKAAETALAARPRARGGATAIARAPAADRGAGAGAGATATATATASGAGGGGARPAAPAVDHHRSTPAAAARAVVVRGTRRARSAGPGSASGPAFCASASQTAP